MNLPLVWYILNKWQTHKCVGCISFLRIVAVLLLLFWTLFWKANCSSFLYGEAEPVKKMESVICCCKYHGTNVLRIALRINLLFLFTWFLVTFSFIYTCLAPLSTIILCQPNRPWKHCNSLPVQANHSTPKLPTVFLLATRLCGIKT